MIKYYDRGPVFKKFLKIQKEPCSDFSPLFQCLIFPDLLFSQQFSMKKMINIVQMLLHPTKTKQNC